MVGQDATPIQFFADPSSVERIALDTAEGVWTGEWVEVKKRLSAGDQDALSDALMTVEQLSSPMMQAMSKQQRREHARKHPEDVMRATMKSSQTALLIIAITGWSFEQEVNEENIKLMLPEWTTQIVDIIDELNPTPSASPQTS
jgi:hypothetical protein